MELLQFVFSSFWVWLGCVVLIVAAGEAVATAAAGFRQKRKVSVYHVGDVTRVEVENAGRADIPARTDTTYFHDYIYGRAEIRFVRGRLRFTDEEGKAYAAAPFPSMVVIYNGNKEVQE